MSQLVTEPAPSASSGDEGPVEAARRAKLQQIRELGYDPWGGRFDGHIPIADIRDRAVEIVFQPEAGAARPLPNFEAGDVDFRAWIKDQGPGEVVGPKVRAAGRIVLHRDKGKLQFIDIRDMTGQLQLFVGQKQVGDDWDLVQCLDLGDIIGVDGLLRRTMTGELSIFAEKIHLLTKTLAAPPEKYHGLTDPELRQRMRYLDLVHGEGVMERFLRRNAIVRSIRDSLNRRGFVEVEGPTLHSIAGGAAAKPFKTHHNALGIDLFMRIALELHLKRLLAGGIEKVYELGRVYRNECISPKHNPEFTMLELYQAYGDYQTMLELAEAFIVEAIEATGQPLVLPWGDATIDFTPPFQRKTYDELFREHTGIDPADAKAVARFAASIGLETAGKHPDLIKNEVFEAKVEDALVGPVFVLDYPASMCPLTKRKADNPEVAERFELFVQGMEIANAYTELNDPDLQEELFRTQLAGIEEEHSMARMDQDFIRALRHGMPPAGGLGVGIDRLVMLLTNSRSIRDVILFPLLRPEVSEWEHR
jgi:lysyl-tRNA synthetase class 2